ncbi:MAG TPA: hypothetical protein PL182_05505 [Pseudobdellovibrionaceae bacterium]|nr:hypothetical protein [Pseudobdellovibrionaceae bacterium]
MKRLSLIALLFAFVPALSWADVPSPLEREVQIGLSGVYVPSGFTAASDVYVVVNGIFQNGCYRWKKAEVKHRDTFVHEIESFAAVSPGMCIMVLVPFQKEIPLGKLAAGTHTLRFENGDGTYLEKSLVIR